MDINDLADKLISKISKCSSNNNSDAVKIEPAIVSYVYSNGNVDVYFPPKDESTKVLTNIQNQTNFILKEGDSVEVLEPKGKLSNCWVIAKHGGGDLKTSASTVTKVQIISSGGTSDTFVETDPTVPTWAKAETKPTYTATEIGLGNVPNVSTNDQTPTYTDTDTLATLTSGETISTVFSKIKKAITSLIDHINNISNPHSVTKDQIGLENVDNIKQYSASNEPPYPITSVEGETGDVVLNNVIKITAQEFSDSEKAQARNNIGAGTSSFDGDFSNLLNIPTTIDGYGFTDANILNGVVTLGSNTITPYTASNPQVNITGNSATATKLSTSRNIMLNGDVSGSTSFDGSGDVTISTVVADNSHTHTVSNITDLTATASEINVLDGITASTTELNYTDGVTSNIQTQLNSKANMSNLAAVATSGSYSDLSNKPAIPTISNTMISRANDNSAPAGSAQIDANLLDGYDSGYFANIQLSSTQPTGQRTNDFWLRIV